MANPTETASLEKLRARFAETADGVLESIASEYGVTLAQAITCLPDEMARSISGEHFAAVMEDISDWGKILLIVHTDDVVLECPGELPKGSFGHGMFNFSGGGPFSGHLRATNCSSIAFLKRPFFGSISASVVFLNRDGGAMFKIFVGRDETRALKQDQLARFDALAAKLSA